jgi:hypothetical protein
LEQVNTSGAKRSHCFVMDSLLSRSGHGGGDAVAGAIVALGVGRSGRLWMLHQDTVVL